MISMIFRGISSIFNSANEITKTAVGSAETRELNKHAEQRAVLEAYLAEYSYAALNRTWFDSFVDGANRLVRPMFTYGIVALLIWAAIDPREFVVAMVALETVPDLMWAIVSLVLTFWFGSRAIKDFGRFSAKGVPAALLERLESRRPPARAPSKKTGRPKTGNPAIDQFYAQNGG